MKEDNFKLNLFLCLILVGISYGFIFHSVVMPWFGGQLLHCIFMGVIFGIVNYLITSKFYKNYRQLKVTNLDLSEKLRMDKLTGLLNRRAFDADISEMQGNTGFSLIFIDIDNFRNFNNLFGHQVGDKILQRVSDVIRSSIRCQDRVYRYGGEEIVVLLNQCDKVNASNIAEKIRFNVSGLDNSPYPEITVSLGVSSHGEDGHYLDDVLIAGDKALLKAKSRGKNCVVADVC
ncbi:diguanylate cyclase [Anaerosolibacter carboniphilus]|uniref:Diguanylate cyclase n=1 Tax=Anaerosolibacter carboniphilus TaxID=1417629 RepID=A0A841KTG2_9FIRM|nr:GGDEF domain-containing protein [Anaerosolibacter carboniphilus]MBB6215448.1 diguanylate cyclase [Anaerosolibacter carboniphilus]